MTEYQMIASLLSLAIQKMQTRKGSSTLCESLEIVALCHEAERCARLLPAYDTIDGFQWDREPLEGATPSQ